jgi:hypothetical protein
MKPEDRRGNACPPLTNLKYNERGKGFLTLGKSRLDETGLVCSQNFMLYG